MIDSFRDLWVSSNLAHGKVLYRDVRFLMGIFPPYLLALFFKIFGIHIHCLIYLDIVLSIVAGIFIYKIALLFLSEIFSTIVVLTFFAVCVFGNYTEYSIFNWIFPYNLSSLCFSLCMLCGLYLLLKYFKSNAKSDLTLMMCSLFFAFLCRPLMTLVPWIGFLLCGIVNSLKYNKKFHLFYFVFPFIAQALVYGLFIILTGSWPGFKESILDLLLFIVKGRFQFNQYSSGFHAPMANLYLMMRIFLIQSVLFFGLFILSNIFQKLSQIFSNFSSKIVFYCLLSVAGLAFSRLFMQFIIVTDFYRAIPLMLVIIIVKNVSCLLLKQKTSNRFLLLFALSILSLILLQRIILNINLCGYAFFLIPPGLIGYYIFWINTFPSFFGNFFRINKALIKYYRFSLFIFFIFSIYNLTSDYFWYYNEKTFKIIFPRGDMICYPEIKTSRIAEAIEYFYSKTPKQSKVVVLPEGIGINFLSERENPLRYESFLPYEIEMFGEENLINMIISHKIDYIVVLGRETSLYGPRFFGKDYGIKLFKWIENNFNIEKIIGCPPFSSPEFGIAIYHKK